MADPQAILRFLRDPNLQTGPFPQWPTLPSMQQSKPQYLSNDPTPWEGGDFPTHVDPMSIAMALMAGKGGKGNPSFAARVMDTARGMQPSAIKGGGSFAGRISIADLYDAYGVKHPDAGPMAEFKKRLVEAARNRELSLQRLDMPELMEDQTRQRSQTPWDSDIVHFLVRDWE